MNQDMFLSAGFLGFGTGAIFTVLGYIGGYTRLGRKTRISLAVVQGAIVSSSFIAESLFHVSLPVRLQVAVFALCLTFILSFAHLVSDHDTNHSTAQGV
jgi:hypothetical protein